MRITDLPHQLYKAIESKNYIELSPVCVGFERCLPEKFFGPHIRQYYLIHFIISGTGVFKNPKGAYRVDAGSAFLIRPGENCIYTADKDDPWMYGWIGFEGKLSARFDEIPDIFSFPAWITDELLHSVDIEAGSEEYLTGILFKLLSSLSDRKEKQDKIRRVTDFIAANYMHDIKVGEISAMLNFDRKYLTRIFRERMGISIKQYLTDKRISEAKRFLSEGFGVAETATLTGYADSFNFSKAFKHQTGVSPLEYKKIARSSK